QSWCSWKLFPFIRDRRYVSGYWYHDHHQTDPLRFRDQRRRYSSFKRCRHEFFLFRPITSTDKLGCCPGLCGFVTLADRLAEYQEIECHSCSISRRIGRLGRRLCTAAYFFCFNGITLCIYPGRILL